MTTRSAFVLHRLPITRSPLTSRTSRTVCTQTAPAETTTSTTQRRHSTRPDNARPHNTQQPSSSFRFWQSYHPNPSDIPSLLSQVARRIASYPSHTPYWITHLGRHAFFSLSLYSTRELGRFLNIIPSMPRRTLVQNHARGTAEALTLFLQDHDAILQGKYNLPWDSRSSVRGLSPLRTMAEGVAVLNEGLRIMRKRGSKQVEGEKVWLEGEFYPEYYKRTFHFQTDGWFSSNSADVYEMGTEALFAGRQDAMQRLALVGISNYMKEKGVTGEGVRMLEIGAGTGRLATFVRDNWPGAELIVSDLSAFYLQKARENMQRWERSRRGDVRGNVRYLQARAEELPVENGSVDVVYCVYLFHELPPEARRRVLREVKRVLKVGGRFILVDSVQGGDRPYAQRAMDNFPDMNEPWYRSWLEERIEDVDGFERREVEMRSVTKLMAFERVEK